MFTFRLRLLTLTTLCCIATPVIAGPKDSDVHEMLIWSNVEETKALYEEVSAGYQAQLKTFLKYRANKRPNQLKALGKTQAEILMLRRRCRHLLPTGEPAVLDIYMRLAELRDEMWKLITASQTLPQTGQILQQITRSMPSFNAKMAKVEQVAQKALANGNWEESEAAIEKFRRDTEPVTTMTNASFHTKYDPIKDEEQKGYAERERAMRIVGANAFAKARNESLPNYSAVAPELSSAVQAIGSAGTATIEGKALTGPELIEHCRQIWVTTQLKALRARAYEWARMAAIGKDETPELKKIVDDYGKFSNAIKGLIAKIIQADANRISEADAKTLYPLYVVAAGKLTSRIPDTAFHDALDQALTQLSAKSTQLTQDVAAFKASTDELLRWKAKVADQAASAKKTGSNSIEGAYYKALMPHQNFRGIFQGKKQVDFAYLSMPTHHIMQMATNELMKKPVYRDGWIGSGSGKGGIAEYRSRTWGIFSQPEAAAKAADDFKAELLVSNTAPPLSLLAAQAIASADQRDWESVGGTVARLSMDTMICQFATLSERAGYFARLDTMPKEEIIGETTKQLTLRADIEPTWLQHKYYLVDLSEE